MQSSAGVCVCVCVCVCADTLKVQICIPFVSFVILVLIP